MLLFSEKMACNFSQLNRTRSIGRKRHLSEEEQFFRNVISNFSSPKIITNSQISSILFVQFERFEIMIN